MMRTSLPSTISNARKVLKSQSHHTKNQRGVPRGHIGVHVGKGEMKRDVVPLTYLSHLSFQDLLKYVEEKYGYHPFMGDLTIPCSGEAFINITSQLNSH